MGGLADERCVPCERGTPPLGEREREGLRAQVPAWTVVRGHHLERTYAMNDFARALDLANRIGAIAEAEGHHPDLHVAWGKLRIEVWTHAIDGLARGDFVLAAKCDRAYAELAGGSGPPPELPPA